MFRPSQASGTIRDLFEGFLPTYQSDAMSPALETGCDLKRKRGLPYARLADKQDHRPSNQTTSQDAVDLSKSSLHALGGVRLNFPQFHWRGPDVPIF